LVQLPANNDEQLPEPIRNLPAPEQIPELKRAFLFFVSSRAKAAGVEGPRLPRCDATEERGDSVRARILGKHETKPRCFNLHRCADRRDFRFYKTPRAREIKSMTMLSEIKICTMVSSFPQRASRGASVGPKVELCVKEIKR